MIRGYLTTEKEKVMGIHEYYYIYRRDGKIRRISSFDREEAERKFERIQELYEIELIKCWEDECDEMTQGGYAEWAW